MNDNVRADQNGVDQNRIWADCLTDHEDEAAYHPSREPDVILDSQTIRFTEANVTELKIGLIGFYRLTQECLTKAVSDLHPEFNITSYITIKECIAGQRSDFDLIIYFLHGSEVSDAMISQTIPPLCEAFPSVPVIIFSDADRLQQPKIMRSALKSGARGFVPTQTANLPITLAAIRFVKAGGTFVPADLLLTARPEAGVARQNRLTSRQASVLGHLARGTPNKIIAYELGMSESTVKVHVRNIMRKMGATNRTEAAYKAQRLSNDFDIGRSADF